MPGDESHRRSRLAPLLVVAAWIAAAVIANVVLALTHANPGDTASALLPPDAKTAAATNRIAQWFPGSGTNAIAYLVVDGRDQLGPADQHYYDAAVSALRADTAHVGSVLDWWSDPLTAPLGTSPDGRSGVAMVWLVGEVGSDKARESFDAARAVVRKLPPSPGLRARMVGPAIDHIPLRMQVWQGAAIAAAAAVIAVLLLLRSRQSPRSVAMVLLATGLSLTVAWPLQAMVPRSSTALTVFSGTLAVVLTIATMTVATLLASRLRPEGSVAVTDRRAYRDLLPGLALPGACVALVTGPLLLAQTPALHSVGTAAPDVAVALAVSLTLLPILLGFAAPRGLSVPQTGSVGWAGRLPKPGFSNPIAVAAVVLAICALPVIGMRCGIGESRANPPGTSAARLLPGNPLPDVVVVNSAADLRQPAGLIAIDQLSHRLMEIPGVRKVESAAWPAGVPWADASLTSAAGKLSDQLNRGAGSFMPQLNAIKSLGATIDQVSAAVDELDNSVRIGLAGANQIQQNINRVISVTQNLRGRAAEVSQYLNPLRDMITGGTYCPDEQLCSAARQLVGPLDLVVADVATLTNGADRMAAVSSQTMGAFASTPHVVAEMRSTLGQLRSFVPKLESSIQEILPQLVQVSAFLKNISVDFADTGEGGFHLTRKELADPSYQHVRQSMFSPDGTATRLFVYSDGNGLDLGAAARVQSLQLAAGAAMKYGSLVDSQITVAGAAQVAAAVRGALTHDAVLLAVTMFTVAALIGLWRGAVSGLAAGLGLAVSYLAALGISVVLWQHLLDRELQAAVPLVSFAILAAFGLPRLVAALLAGESAGTVTLAGATPLIGLGGVFAGGLLLVSSASPGALSQLGTVVLIGLGVLTAAARVFIPAAIRRGHAQRPAAVESPATDS
ncbi:MMPL family transporter [Mycobacterium ostraviense]|uniref:MMPL family transporter n=1 Tax=Mycobacterium ostraviense TaxID=2738409 RepID=UPI00094C9177|nr:MMPL family transporter [Mycobacterium ostraviense]